MCQDLLYGIRLSVAAYGLSPSFPPNQYPSCLLGHLSLTHCGWEIVMIFWELKGPDLCLLAPVSPRYEYETSAQPASTLSWDYES